MNKNNTATRFVNPYFDGASGTGSPGRLPDQASNTRRILSTACFRFAMLVAKEIRI